MLHLDEVLSQVCEKITQNETNWEGDNDLKGQGLFIIPVCFVGVLHKYCEPSLCQ